MGVLEEVGRRFDESADGEHDVKAGSMDGGSFLAWVYHQAGRWPLAVKPFALPTKLPKKKEPAKFLEFGPSSDLQQSSPPGVVRRFIMYKGLYS